MLGQIEKDQEEIIVNLEKKAIILQRSKIEIKKAQRRMEKNEVNQTEIEIGVEVEDGTQGAKEDQINLIGTLQMVREMRLMEEEIKDKFLCLWNLPKNQFYKNSLATNNILNYG